MKFKTVMLLSGITLLALLSTPIRPVAQEPALTYSVLYAFTGGTDGSGPDAGLVQDAAGNLYGTTFGGGNTSSTCPNGSAGCGVVFKLDPEGTETVLYTFTGGADGRYPVPGLVLDAAGNLYGTTSNGGNIGSTCVYGCGVVFKLDPEGTETVLHTFTGGTDGSGPAAGLVQDAAGNLYGTTSEGGNTSSTCQLGSSGCGVVFKLDPLGHHYRVLYTFTGGTDGSNPEAGLVRDAQGNLYRETSFGGNTSSSTCPFGSSGCGVVFKLDPEGTETVLYTFTGGTDGSRPGAGLARDAAGNLYGGTPLGGNTSSTCPNGSSGCGVVFKLDAQDHYRVLYTFEGGTDGSVPVAGLVQDGAGNLYGTTSQGGNTSITCLFSLPGCGVVFSLDPSGKERVLYAFTGGPDGGVPYSGLLLYRGSLYGTTYDGGNTSSSCPFGSTGCGVVFKLH